MIICQIKLNIKKIYKKNQNASKLIKIIRKATKIKLSI